MRMLRLIIHTLYVLILCEFCQIQTIVTKALLKSECKIDWYFCEDSEFLTSTFTELK
jgi:hypothetical protein